MHSPLANSCILSNLTMLYIMEPNVLPFIGFGARHDVINDIMHYIIGIE